MTSQFLLFNGKNFDGFDTLLERHGINNDPDKVFRWKREYCIYPGRSLAAW